MAKKSFSVRKRNTNDAKNNNTHNQKPISNLIEFEWKKIRSMIICTLFCCINMAFHEQTLRFAPKSSNFISFVQHLFITICGMITLGLPFDFGSYKSLVPTKFYLPLVLLSFFAILTNNLAYNYGVSIPLNMIFKSSSLVANMLLGMLFLRHRYSMQKFFSIMSITIGLIICTLEDYRIKHSLTYEDILSKTFYSFWIPEEQEKIKNIDHDKSTWESFIGITMLTISFLLSAAIGIYQEYLSKNFRKNSNEMLYYVHLLSLPIFLLTSTNDIIQHFHIFIGSIAYNTNLSKDLLSLLNYPPNHLLPLYLLLTVLLQYLCVRSIYKLTTECSSLSVTICLTNRKFLSLIISIFYFGNKFTKWHWFGSIIVFGGTICFYLMDALSSSNNTEKTRQNSMKKKQF